MASSAAPTVEEPKTASREEILTKSKYPVFLPYDESVRMSFDDLEDFIKRTVSAPKLTPSSEPLIKEDWSEAPVRQEETPDKSSRSVSPSKCPAPSSETSEDQSKPVQGQPFMDALAREGSPSKRNRTNEGLAENQMFTENQDVAYRSTNSALVDLFFELSDQTSNAAELLENAWREDPLKTLKLIWNSRSIHLGKSSRLMFYACYSWLAENHPQTALLNLRWLARPVIPKRAEKKEEGAGADDDMIMVDEEATKMTLENENPYRWDVKYGVSHGYWKDLLNLVAFAANGELKTKGKFRKVTNPDRTPGERYLKDHKLLLTHQRGDSRFQVKGKHDNYEAAKTKYQSEPFYKALHVVVAKLFAEQIKEDGSRLTQNNKAEMHKISLAAKWTPTAKGTHDKHTRILSTIAEMLYTPEDVCPDNKLEGDQGREVYLRFAREQLRMALISPLRKYLDVVERNITAKTFANIDYSKVPSLAMSRYSDLFEEKDPERFGQFILDVTTGKANISGATLLPSTLVNAASDLFYRSHGRKTKHSFGPAVLNVQWNTLVKRIRDSGTMENSIAVCDVSGSMTGPRLHDGTTPMDSSIGLSLLVAEITKPPFGGMFITFSERPQTQEVGGEKDGRDLTAKIAAVRNSSWGYNTDFEAVFSRLILPMAVNNKLSQEDMVKRIFVFSDMQFDQSQCGPAWSTSYQRIKKAFDQAGYAMPQLVFWNLAGSSQTKPTTADEEGVVLVSGYSQGMLKVFLDGGQFDDAEDEEEESVVTKDGEGGEETAVIVDKKKKDQMNSIKLLEKAIGHDAYQMLRVVD